MHTTYTQFGHALLRAYCKDHNSVADAVNFIVKHCTDDAWDCVSRSLQMMEDSFARKTPYTDQFVEWAKREMQKQFELDMIYYTICHDGFRL